MFHFTLLLTVKEPKESVHSKAVDDSKEGETRTTRSKRNQQKLPEPGPAKKRAASIAEQTEKMSRNKSESSDDEITPPKTTRVQSKFFSLFRNETPYTVLEQHLTVVSFSIE